MRQIMTSFRCVLSPRHRSISTLFLETNHQHKQTRIKKAGNMRERLIDQLTNLFQTPKTAVKLQKELTLKIGGENSLAPIT